jgi:ammonium transporter, Amt family
MVAGMLVLFMQAGLALVTSGLCRAKNAGQIVAMSFMVYPLTVLGFWFIGFALMFGGLLHDPANGSVQWLPNHGLPLLSKEWGPGIFGYDGFFLHRLGANALVLRLFFFQAGVVAVAVAIPVSAMAERWSFRSFMLYACWAAALPIALFGNWVWGSGWLSQLGREFGLGHGYVDFAGSSVAHMTGGIIGLAGASIIGPRVGKFARDGRPRPMPGHNLVYVVLGTLILAFGWFGFNLGPALAEGHERVPTIVFNTVLASATGTIGAYIVVVTKFGKPDPSMLCNGMLAGLVAISGPCAFVSPWGAVIIGAVAGVLVVYSVLFFEGKLKVDDPVGAVSVHGVSGAWGVLSIGLFANSSYGAGWNGVHNLAKDGTEIGVAGAFGTLFGSPVNDWSQLAAQGIGALTCLIFVGLSAYLWFKVSNLIVPLRSRREAEISGLDLPEMGAECYPDFHITDKGTPHGD